MNILKEQLKKIWKNEIFHRVNNGFITYERQLQAEMYYHLRRALPDQYEIWIEPVIYEFNKVKPDSEAISLKNVSLPRNFIHLTGFIDDSGQLFFNFTEHQ